jgi:hypothetical protein
MRKASWVCLSSILLVWVSVAPAQNTISNGAISGSVSDPSGFSVPNAKVVAKNLGTGVERTTTTNSAGLYGFPSMGVGSYELVVSHDGFKAIQVRDVVVQVGQTTTQNVQLNVGAVTEQVIVEGSSPLFQTTESSVSTVVNQKLIEELPLSGRRYTDFVLLTPNVNADGDFGLVSVAGQQGGADSGYANGNGSNSFTVDGANASSNYFGEARGRTRVPYVFGEQSILEFQVADNPYSAAYGGAGSGFVNTVTKSGTDMFHGDAFYYNRNSGTGANDFVDNANGRPRPLNVLQQFGADLGGPIAHSKAWFYFDYEQQRQLNPISAVDPGYQGRSATDFGLPAGTTLPAPNSPFPVPAGFSAPPASNDPNYPIYLQQVSNALNVFNRNVGQRARRRDNISFFPKVDWQAGANDHLTFVYNYGKFDSPGGEYTFNPVSSVGVDALSNNYVRDHHSSIHWTHTFSPDLLNDFQISFLRDEQIPKPSGLIDPKLPDVRVYRGGFFEVGNWYFANSDTKEFQWEFAEGLNWTRGRHELKMGLSINRSHVADFFPGNFLGTYNFFGSFNDFALGKYSTFTQNTGTPTFPFTFPYYGFYFQDKYKVRSNLTLDLGVREDFQIYPQPKENPAFPLTGQFPNRYQHISPRLGFAYQAFKNTVVRGGFGMFYEIFDGINYENSVISNGLATQQASAFFGYNKNLPPNQQMPTFPNPVSSSLITQPASSNLSLVDPGFRAPYILESSLEIQQRLSSSTTITFGTMWTHAVHLSSSSAYDMNLIRPTGTTTYIACPATAQTPADCKGPSVTLPTLDSGLLSEGALSAQFPNLGGQVNALISPGINHYNSFYSKFERRISRGVAFLISYTFSKNMVSHGADFSNQFDFSNTHSPSLLDQRHRLSVAAIYQPDVSKWDKGAPKTLLSNWTFSTVMQFSSGRPYAALLNSACTDSNFTLATPFNSLACDGSNDTLNDSAINESTGNTATGINGAGPSPVVGLNSFNGPWIQEVDLGIARTFHLTERHSIMLRAQAFNLFNHPNFFVQNGSGVLANQFTPHGLNCGDGATSNQTCYLLPNPAFGTFTSISELNGPRIFQFSFQYKF